MDVYQLAAQANILNIPGSAVEDRQYQINVNGICAYTTTWKNYQQSIVKVSNLFTEILNLRFQKKYRKLNFNNMNIFEPILYYYIVSSVEDVSVLSLYHE